MICSGNIWDHGWLVVHKTVHGRIEEKEFNIQLHPFRITGCGLRRTTCCLRILVLRTVVPIVLFLEPKKSANVSTITMIAMFGIIRQGFFQ